MPPSSPHPLWGWTPAVRVLLSVLAAFGGAVLMFLARDAGRTTPAPLPALVVDLNTAPREVLQALPRLGPVLVDRIVTAREEAPFRSLDDFDARVKGIGPATIAALRPYVRIEPIARAASPNTSTRLVAAKGTTP
ncbi:MAG: helix-hairpin-helix domain-containing protein [Isosphaeraceae bacterium]|nr:helix-hairpin-helix domain-containing protein [Isosphaeraceae bacterium]